MTDYIETVPGALKKWEAFLQAHTIDQGPRDLDDYNGKDKTDGSRFIFFVYRFVRGLASLKWLLGSNHSLPLHTPRGNAQPGQCPANSRDCDSRQWLLLCLPYRCRAFRVLQLELDSTLSDQMLFQRLQKQYWQLRGRFRHFLSLRMPTAIKFVQVSPYQITTHLMSRDQHLDITLSLTKL